LDRSALLKFVKLLDNRGDFFDEAARRAGGEVEVFTLPACKELSHLALNLAPVCVTFAATGPLFRAVFVHP
jgi:hypothetical protein